MIPRGPGVVASLALAGLAVAGCAGLPRLAVEKEPAVCKVPPVVTAPVAAPEPLRSGSTNGDMKMRMDALDAALEKANGRLEDVQKTLSASQPTKTAPTMRERLRAFLGK